MIVYRGAPINLQASFQDESGAYIDPLAGSISLDVLLLGATVAGPWTAEVVRDAQGLYHYTWAVPADLAPGFYVARWQATLPGGLGASLGYETLEVQASGPLTLAEAKAGLNIQSATNDAELQGWLDASTELVEGIVGPVRHRAVLEHHPATDREYLYLRETPVVSVQSIVRRYDNAALYVAGDLEVDALSGRVALLAGGVLGAGWGGLTVAYTAGRAQVPESIRKAIIIVLDHLWQTQRGWASGAPSLRGELPPNEGGAPVPAGFALPNRAKQLLMPYARVAVG